MEKNNRREVGMDPINATDNNVSDNELQKAIDNITNASSAGNVGQDATAATPKDVASEIGDAVALEANNATVTGPSLSERRASYGDPDLGAVKTNALADLRPIIEEVDLSPESKFKIYREIILATNDKAAIEPAYNAAKNIAIDKDKAEALLFVVEIIDKLGIGVS